jgi:hypothetical protein
MLQNERKGYEQRIGDLTTDERQKLRKWVNAGNSVLANPYLLDGEDGHPLDYIRAMRTNDEMVNHPDDFSWGAVEENGLECPF